MESPDRHQSNGLSQTKIVNKEEACARMKVRYGTGKIGTLSRHIPVPMDGAEEGAVSGYGRCDVGRVQDSKSHDYFTLFQYP